MEKLQCLNIAKTFLSTNFKKSMQHLADKNHWRDSFKDQLHVDFKDWMYQSISNNLDNKAKSGQFKDEICTDQVMKIGSQKDPIKRSVRFGIEQREKQRQIESKDKRSVHFLFNSGLPTTISPFARKLTKLMDGTLEETEANEKEAFAGYIERMTNEELEENEVSPIKFENSPYFVCELGQLNRICFSTADDPFYKLTTQMYYPECVVANAKGEILATVNHTERENNTLGLTYQDDIRDPVLKINDDRKVQIQLGAMREAGTMIFLLVRQFDNSSNPVSKDAFERAWFRVSNEETNQTIDYSLVNKIETPEGYEEMIPREDEEEGPPLRNELIYLHGVLYLEQVKSSTRWVFESYKQVFQGKDYPDIAKSLTSLYQRATDEIEDQQKQISEAGNALKKSLEEKKLQAMEAAKKQKGKGKKKKGDDDPADEGADLTNTKTDFNKTQDEEFDLFVPDSFKKALQAKVPRPFIFGPVEFDGLHLTDDVQAFEPEQERHRVTGVLERNITLPSGLCVHGYKVCVKKRNLKRRSSILKHARFLQNMEVFPTVPPEPVIEEEGEGSGGEGD